MNRIGERRGRRPGDRAGYLPEEGQSDANKSGPGAPGSTASFRFSNSILAVLFALSLAACGGGGGSATGSGDNGGPRGPGPGNSGKQPGLTAGGVTVLMSNNMDGVANTSMIIRKGVVPWTVPPANTLTAPTGWKAETKLSGDSTLETTGRFHAVTDYATDGDDDYLAYGFWSRNTPDTLDSSGFQSFFYGNMPYAGNIAALPIVNPTNPATVTYTGGAAGVYSISGSDSHGFFRAVAELTTQFGKNGSVRGRIKSIESLSNSPAFSFVDITTLFADFSGNNRFSGTGPHGSTSWGGQFFGPSDSGQIPTGIAGWFEKVVTGSPVDNDDRRAILSGSFGATCSENCN